jgi:hypothetical protein
MTPALRLVVSEEDSGDPERRPPLLPPIEEPPEKFYWKLLDLFFECISWFWGTKKIITISFHPIEGSDLSWASTAFRPEDVPLEYPCEAGKLSIGDLPYPVTYVRARSSKWRNGHPPIIAVRYGTDPQKGNYAYYLVDVKHKFYVPPES